MDEAFAARKKKKKKKNEGSNTWPDPRPAPGLAAFSPNIMSHSSSPATENNSNQSTVAYTYDSNSEAPSHIYQSIEPSDHLGTVDTTIRDSNLTREKSLTVRSSTLFEGIATPSPRESQLPDEYYVPIPFKVIRSAPRPYGEPSPVPQPWRTPSPKSESPERSIDFLLRTPPSPIPTFDQTDPAIKEGFANFAECNPLLYDPVDRDSTEIPRRRPQPPRRAKSPPPHLKAFKSASLQACHLRNLATQIIPRHGIPSTHQPIIATHPPDPNPFIISAPLPPTVNPRLISIRSTSPRPRLTLDQACRSPPPPKNKRSLSNHLAAIRLVWEQEVRARARKEERVREEEETRENAEIGGWSWNTEAKGTEMATKMGVEMRGGMGPETPDAHGAAKRSRIEFGSDVLKT